MPVLLPMAKLKAVCNPLDDPPWIFDPWIPGPITHQCVLDAIRRKRLEKVAFCATPGEESREWHIGRIAWLCVHGWKDAIEIDVGIPSMGYSPVWMVTDGNHRVAAAIWLGDQEIMARVGGDLEYALELFGVDCEERDG